MPEIIPAIIAKDFSDLKEKIRLVEPYVKTVQLDIMDGVFVPNETWREPADLVNLETSLFLEVHLMVARPYEIVNQWLATKTKRLIVHFESASGIFNHKLMSPRLQVDGTFPIFDLAGKVHKNHKEFGMALNPETSLEVLDAFIKEIDLVLLMSVNPGFAGQEFQESVVPKIIALRQKYPDVKIGVDGGVNLQNAKRLKDAGADFLAVGSAIFESKNISETIREFESILTK